MIVGSESGKNRTILYFIFHATADEIDAGYLQDLTHTYTKLSPSCIVVFAYRANDRSECIRILSHYYAYLHLYYPVALPVGLMLRIFVDPRKSAHQKQYQHQYRNKLKILGIPRY